MEPSGRASGDRQNAQAHRRPTLHPAAQIISTGSGRASTGILGPRPRPSVIGGQRPARWERGEPPSTPTGAPPPPPVRPPGDRPSQLSANLRPWIGIAAVALTSLTSDPNHAHHARLTVAEEEIASRASVTGRRRYQDSSAGPSVRLTGQSRRGTSVYPTASRYTTPTSIATAATNTT